MSPYGRQGLIFSLDITLSGNRNHLRAVGMNSEIEIFKSNMDNLRDQGKYAEMLKLIDERRKTYPSDPFVFYYKGIVHIFNMEYKEALGAFEMVNYLAPQWDSKFTKDYIDIAQRGLDGEKFKFLEKIK